MDAPCLCRSESLPQAVTREVAEETGMRCEVTALVGIYSDPGHVAAYDDGEVRQEFSICYATRLLGGQIQTSAESSAVRFVSQDELRGYTIHPSIQRRIGRYLEHRPGPYIGLTD